MSEEDVSISSLLVSLSCFLCPNCSMTPANRYLGVFEDLHNAHKFDWAKFVYSWLLERVKSFNKGKNDALKEPAALGGCLYLIAVGDFLLFQLIFLSITTLWLISFYKQLI